MINYPNKKSFYNKGQMVHSNLGMELEELINKSNEYYNTNDIAFIFKRPTNIKVIKTEDYYHISEAVFLKPSTLDYVGVYKGLYLDFEAKSTISKKGFPISNISPHQVEAMKKILLHHGKTFIIIEMTSFNNEIYLIDGKDFIDLYNNNKTVISYDSIKEKGHLLHSNYFILLDYLNVIDKLYL